ncbi:hypothetical protein E4U48_004772 [Claviceps purpurea]|nr:hypothetical protein E4U25_003674 [Claviceps purpurea]KAG6268239.1 hypothetical protein E4U48_004772 [Claviceps purpurea]
MPHKHDKNRGELPAFWSEANELDTGEPPAHLPTLLPLTTSGSLRVCTYPCASHPPTMHHRLDVPQGNSIFSSCGLASHYQTDQPRIIPQIRIQLNVRRLVVRQWLDCLKESHSDYSDITTGEVLLGQLPDNIDVNAELQTENVDPVDLGRVREFEQHIGRAGEVILSEVFYRYLIFILRTSFVKRKLRR